MQGLLLVNKPKSWTSFDVVARVRSIIASEQKVKPAQVKVGHTGTLDPLAEGLLLLLIGKKYTKQAAKFSKLDKKYKVEIILGEVSESGDSETKPYFYSSYKPSLTDVEQSLQTFTGRIMQLPPAYSALKVNGQRAYKLARQGKAVELKARPVNIYKLQLLEYNYPVLKLETNVSSGTYIRSLVVDLGKELKTGAYMKELTRISIGKYTLKDSLKSDKLDYAKISRHLIILDGS